MNCVTSNTPPFSVICVRTKLSFYVVIRHMCGFDFFFMVGARYGLSLGFWQSLVLKIIKFSAVFQLFGLKTTSHCKPGQKIHFRGHI